MSPASSVTPKTAFPSFFLLAPYFEVFSAAGWLLLFSNGTASSFFIDLPRVKRFGKLFDRYISVWLVIVHPVLLLTGALIYLYIIEFKSPQHIKLKRQKRNSGIYKTFRMRFFLPSYQVSYTSPLKALRNRSGRQAIICWQKGEVGTCQKSTSSSSGFYSFLRTVQARVMGAFSVRSPNWGKAQVTAAMFLSIG